MKRIPFFIGIICLMCVNACHLTNFSDIDLLLPGVSSPYRLSPDGGKLILRDYFPNVGGIDSVVSHIDLKAVLAPNKHSVTLEILDPSFPAVTVLHVYILGKKYTIPVIKSSKIKLDYVFHPEGQTYENVSLAGDLNDWNPANTPLEFKDSIWTTTLLKEPGNYQYQVVVDGKWMLDPANPDTVDNNIGGLNSLLKVGGKNHKKLTLTTENFNPDEIEIGIRGEIDGLIAMWESKLIVNQAFTGAVTREIIPIPSEAKSMSRSHIRVWAWKGDVRSNDLLIPLSEGVPVGAVDEITRKDKHSTIMYFLLVDRFNNGNFQNDFPLDDPEVDFKANYQGGDLIGITQKVKDGYFKDLGFNTVWISPITQNPLKAFVEYPAPHRKYSGYHGYWPITTTTIDHRFGTDPDLRELVGSLHENDMNLLLDFVSNHVHEEHILYTSHPDWATPLYLPPDSTINVRIWEEQRLTTWFDTFLPTLDLSRKEVIDAVSDSALYWMVKFDLDGYRHDATKHIPERFWRTLSLKLKNRVYFSQKKDVLQMGETFGSRELIGSYVGSGMMDGQFDFNLYFDARSVFATDSESFKKLQESLQSSFEFYGWHSLMGNITGNHDIPRFISFAGEAMKFDEDDKEAGWSRDIQVENPVGYQKLNQLIAFIMTIPGIPVVYYGDEWGMPGAGDPDNRRFMKFGDHLPNEQSTLETNKKIIQLRKNNLSLIYGDFDFVKCTDETMVYTRKYFNETAIIAFNKSSEIQKIVFDLPHNQAKEGYKPHFGNELTLMGNSAGLTLPPYSFEILINNTKAP